MQIEIFPLKKPNKVKFEFKHFYKHIINFTLDEEEEISLNDKINVMNFIFSLKYHKKKGFKSINQSKVI